MSHVLLVFGDPAVGARLAAVLAEAGFGTRAVTSGERAMDRFIQEPSDVVVVDFDLEGRDGITTTEAIRWMPGGRRARFVLTAHEEPEDGPLAKLGAAVDAFAALVGPLDPQRLLEVVQRAAAVEPNTAETRVLSTEHALLEAERRRSADSEDEKGTVVSDRIDLQTPVDGGIVIADELDSTTPLTTDLEDATLDEPAMESWEWRDTDGRMEGMEVRQLAEHAAEAHSALLGTFDKMPFPRLLHRLAERRATGALICVHPPDERQTTEGTEPTKIVYFRSGVPVHVRSNLLGECLGQVLARAQKIGPVALKESLRAMHRGEGRQGEVLLEMGAIGPLELSEALAQQMRLKLYELFAWQLGSFRLTPNRRPPRDLIDLELGLAEITFRGLMATREPEEIVSMLEGDRDLFVIPQARRLVRFLPLSADRGLRSVIRRADGTRTLGEILEGSSSPGRAAVLVHAMECLDAVRFESEPLRAPTKPASSLPSVPSAIATFSTGSAPLPESLSLDSAVSDPPSALDSLDELGVAPEPGMRAERGPGRDEERTSVAKFPSPEPTSAANALAAAAASAADSSSEPVSVHLAPAVPEPLRKVTPRPPEPDESDPSQPPQRDETGSGLRTRPDRGLDERVERLLKAERRIRRGQRALAKSKLAQAVEAFEEAVELCPEEAQFAVHLAWARHIAHPGDEELLEACLFSVARACKESPGLLVAHLVRARLLRSAGRPAEATKSYRRVLEIEPGHTEAAAEMAELSP